MAPGPVPQVEVTQSTEPTTSSNSHLSLSQSLDSVHFLGKTSCAATFDAAILPVPTCIPLEGFELRRGSSSDSRAIGLLLSSILTDYRLSYCPETSDADALEPEAYPAAGGEFWVLVQRGSDIVVGTAAFRRDASVQGAAELRKMFLNPSVRGRGLGRFLLHALESRAYAAGASDAVLESARILKEACALYTSAGYSETSDVSTPRCDVAMRKTLQAPLENYVRVVGNDGTWFADIPESVAKRANALVEAVACVVVKGKRAWKASFAESKWEKVKVGENAVEIALRYARSVVGMPVEAQATGEWFLAEGKKDSGKFLCQVFVVVLAEGHDASEENPEFLSRVETNNLFSNTCILKALERYEQEHLKGEQVF